MSPPAVPLPVGRGQKGEQEYRSRLPAGGGQVENGRGMSLSVVADIMMEFARRTGLSPEREFPRRYLWTDAFAVCNFLELFRGTQDETYKGLAALLVDQVHGTLGRHRPDDSRSGWISGLGEEQGALHPTIGGLRIGKKLKERGRAEPYDERLEWDRDGQYYHYLTQWMHALHRMGTATGNPSYYRWALELARTAHERFVYLPSSGGQRRMYWKMGVDLSFPLVVSMGHHDPLDGWITCMQLQTVSAEDPAERNHVDLRGEIADLADICEGKNWTTDDSLGTGGLLADAFRVAQLTVKGGVSGNALLETLLGCCLQGLAACLRGDFLRLPPEYRLPFRELGLSIGLHAAERLGTWVELHSDHFDRDRLLDSGLGRLMQFTRLGHAIEKFWLEPRNQQANTWKEHRDINMVMLATSLAPEGYLIL